MDAFMEFVKNYGPKAIGAVITLLVGLWVIKIAMKIFQKTLEKSKMEPTLNSFILSLLGVGLKILLVITVLTMAGVEMTSFVALIGAAGLAVGLALQGSLSNFAGGVLIIFFKPFKVGDFIEANGNAGTVREIQILHTILTTPDNKVIIIPNGPLSNSVITNFSREGKRRVDMTFGVGYEADIREVQKILSGIVAEDNRVMKEPAPMIRLLELADSSVNFTVRMWVKTSDYWNVYFDTQEKVKLAFDENGISIPFPQMDVHFQSSNLPELVKKAAADQGEN